MCSINFMNSSSLSDSQKEQTNTCQSFQPSFKDLERIQLVRVASVWLIHVEARKTLNIYPSIATVLPTNWIACHLHTQLQIAQIHQIMTSNCHRSAADDSWLSQRPVQCPSTVNCRNATPNQLWYVVKIPMWSTSWTPELRAKCEKKGASNFRKTCWRDRTLSVSVGAFDSLICSWRHRMCYIANLVIQ